MSKEFDQLESRLFERMMEFDPIFATSLGLHQFDSRLPSIRKSDILSQIEEMKKFLKEFEEFDSSSLSFDRELDRKLAIHILRLKIFRLGVLKDWKRDPDVCQLLGELLFHLLIRDYPSKKERLRSLTERLRGMPKLIEDFKSNIKEPVKLWTEIAIESCDRFPAFLKSVLKLTGDEGALKELGELIARIESTLANYKKWLLSVLPNTNEDFAMGKEKFEELLKLREVGLTSDQILEIGERYLKEYKGRLKRFAGQINPDLTVDEVVEKIKSHHPPNFGEVLKSYREAMERAKGYTINAGVATIPSDEAVRIVPAPEFLVHLMPSAGLYSPPKFEKKRVGIFTICPPRSNEVLREHNYYSIINTAVHEAYPGHHLQLTCAACNPSLIRALSVTATEFIEGWAHYCEDYMDEIGYSSEVEVRLIRTIDMIWRACRVIIDVRLSQGSMKFDEAVNFLVKDTRMEREMAVKEIRIYTQRPGYFLSYLIGKHMIKELKKEYREHAGESYSDRNFHDSLLYSGSLPIKYQKRILLGRLKEN